MYTSSASLELAQLFLSLLCILSRRLPSPGPLIAFVTHMVSQIAPVPAQPAPAAASTNVETAYPRGDGVKSFATLQREHLGVATERDALWKDVEALQKDVEALCISG